MRGTGDWCRGVASGEAYGVSSSSVSEIVPAGEGGPSGSSLICARACKARARWLRMSAPGRRRTGGMSTARSQGGPGFAASPTRRPRCGSYPSPAHQGGGFPAVVPRRRDSGCSANMSRPPAQHAVRAAVVATQRAKQVLRTVGLRTVLCQACTPSASSGGCRRARGHAAGDPERPGKGAQGKRSSGVPHQCHVGRAASCDQPREF